MLILILECFLGRDHERAAFFSDDVGSRLGHVALAAARRHFDETETLSLEKGLVQSTEGLFLCESQRHARRELLDELLVGVIPWGQRVASRFSGRLHHADTSFLEEPLHADGRASFTRAGREPRNLRRSGPPCETECDHRPYEA